MAEVLERLAAARDAVEQSCHLLLTPSPEVLDRCSAILSRAISELLAGRAFLKPLAGDPAILAEARKLQSKVFLAGRLLQGAASYHSGWDRTLRSMASGYTAGGDAAPLARPGRLVVEG